MASIVITYSYLSTELGVMPLFADTTGSSPDMSPRVEQMVMLPDDVIADMLSLSDLTEKIQATLEALVEATPEP